MKVMHYEYQSEFNFGPNVVSQCTRYWENREEEIAKGALRVTKEIEKVNCWICLRHINKDWPNTTKKSVKEKSGQVNRG